MHAHRTARSRYRLEAMLACLVLAGCGHQVLYKNGQPANPAELRVDSLNCERDAARTYPFAQVISSTGGSSTSSVTTNCSPGIYGSLSCNSSGFSGAAPTISTVDGNSDNRQRYYASCMSALGYYQVFISNDQTNYRQQTSDRSVLGAPNMCRSSADCATGQSCRSIPGTGGRLECR